MPYETPALKVSNGDERQFIWKLQDGEGVGWVDHRRLQKGVLI